MTIKTAKVHKNLDLLGLLLLNWGIQTLTSDPATTYARIYFNSNTGKLRLYNSTATAWEDVGGGSGGLTQEQVEDFLGGGFLVAGNNIDLTYNDNGTGTGTLTIDVEALTKSDVGLANVDNVQQLPMSYLDTDAALAANSNVKVPSQAAVKAYADSLIAANDAMVFKGVIDASANPNYPASNRGETYRISVAGKIGGAAGPNVEVGDIVIALTDGTAAGNHATVGANWTIIQSNLDGAVIGPASAADGDFAQFDGTSGKLLKKRTPSEVLTDLGLTTVTRKFAATIGDGTTADIVVTHNLGTKDVITEVRDVATDEPQDTFPVPTSINQVTIYFPTAPANNSLRVVIVG